MFRRILLALFLFLLPVYTAACHTGSTDVDEGAACSIILNKEDREDTAGQILSEKEDLLWEGLEGKKITEIAPRTGYLAPPFSLDSLNGNKLSLDHFCGEHLLVVFWESDCFDCEKTLALLEGVHTSDDRITVLGVNVQPEEEILRELVLKRGYSFPILLDIEGKVFNDYQLKSVPAIIAINGRGEITYLQQGPMNEDNLKNIRQILLEQWELRPIIV